MTGSCSAPDTAVWLSSLGALFLLLPVAEEKTCKINVAGEPPQEAGWQLTLPGGPSPKYLLVEFAGSCCVFAVLGGGFLSADAYKKNHLEHEFV